MIQLIHSALLFPNISWIKSQIRPSFQGSASSCNINFPVVHHPWALFKPASIPEVAKLILSSPYKSCEHDAIPTFLLKFSLHYKAQALVTVLNLIKKISKRIYHMQNL